MNENCHRNIESRKREWNNLKNKQLMAENISDVT